MARKVDSKTLAKQLVGIAREDVTSREISDILASAGHKVSTQTIAGFLAWSTIRSN